MEEDFEAMKSKFDEVVEIADKMKEKLDIGEDKGKEVYEEDLELQPNPPI